MGSDPFFVYGMLSHSYSSSYMASVMPPFPVKSKTYRKLKQIFFERKRLAPKQTKQ